MNSWTIVCVVLSVVPTRFAFGGFCSRFSYQSYVCLPSSSRTSSSSTATVRRGRRRICEISSPRILQRRARWNLQDSASLRFPVQQPLRGSTSSSESVSWQDAARIPRTVQRRSTASRQQNEATTSERPRGVSDATTTITARSLALSALVLSATNQRPALERLESLPTLSQLEVRDRAFARLLVATVERRWGQLDQIIAYCSKRKNDVTSRNSNPQQQQKPPKLDPLVRSVLHLGLAQLIFLQVPSYAAVQETVELLRLYNDTPMDSSVISQGSRKRKNPTHSPKSEAKIKYVNAVLRRVGRSIDATNQTGASSTSILQEASADDLRLNAAPWLWKELDTTWGTEAMQRILESALQESPRCLTLRIPPFSTGDGSSTTDVGQEQQIQELIDLFGGPSAIQLVPQGSVRVVQPPPGPISSWPLYDTGGWWLQDVSATLPAIALHRAMMGAKSHQKSPESVVIDLCAAPGGKTAQLCNCFPRQQGFRVIAVEKSKARSKRLYENLERLQLAEDVEVVVADGTQWIPPPTTKVAGVLLDAPCTATGTASKRPDVLRRSSNYQELLETQFQLASHVLDHYFDPSLGGILVYATCSLLKAEREDQIVKLLEKYPNTVQLLPFAKGELSGFDAAIDPTHGWLRVLPGDPNLIKSGVHPCDGFFVARLQRIPSAVEETES